MVDDPKTEMKRGAKLQEEVGVAAIAAATATTELPVFRAPCAGRVTKIGFVPAVAITGADTDSFTIQFKNKGAAGTGTAVMVTKAYVAGVDVAASDFEDLGTVSNGVLAVDDVVNFEKVKVGNGMDMPALIAVIVFEPDWKAWT